jgi:hypothetical protein
VVEEAVPDAVPVPALELLALELPPPAPTESPTCPVREVTMPAAGATSFVASRVFRAAFRLTVALSTAASADATSAAI